MFTIKEKAVSCESVFTKGMDQSRFRLAFEGENTLRDSVGNVGKDTGQIGKNDIQKNFLKVVQESSNVEIKGKNNADFTGKLRGEDITLKGVKTEEISYIKRDTLELNNLRNDFNKTVRSDFLKDLSKDTDYLKKAGFSDKDILKIKNGKVPDGWQVHHKLPIDDSGTNNFDNLALIRNEPYHKVITNFQNFFAKELKIGEIKKVEWPIPDGNIYPPKH